MLRRWRILPESRTRKLVVVMPRSRLVMVMLGRRRLRNSLSPGC